MTTATLRSGTLPGMVNPVGRGTPERRTQLLDVREMRIAPAACEVRQLRNGDLVATGYASTFEEYEVYGGPERYGWIEQIANTAFTKTMAQGPDVVYLVNHAGLPLARTKSGTLKLGVDTGGLAVEALLEPSDPDVQALVPKMNRGDVDEMSFAFYVKAQQWSAAPGWEDDPYSFRTITELSIHRGDVSVVTFGANPTTSAALGTVTDGGMLRAGDEPRGAKRTHIDLGKPGAAPTIEQLRAGATPPPADDAPDGRASDAAPDAKPDETPQGPDNDETPEGDGAGDAGTPGGEGTGASDPEGEALSLDAARSQLQLRSGVADLRQLANLPEDSVIDLATARGMAPKADTP